MAICNGIGECVRKSGNFDCPLAVKRKQINVGSLPSEKSCRVDFEQRDNLVMGSLQLLECLQKSTRNDMKKYMICKRITCILFGHH